MTVHPGVEITYQPSFAGIPHSPRLPGTDGGIGSFSLAYVSRRPFHRYRLHQRDGIILVDNVHARKGGYSFKLIFDTAYQDGVGYPEGLEVFYTPVHSSLTEKIDQSGLRVFCLVFQRLQDGLVSDSSVGLVEMKFGTQLGGVALVFHHHQTGDKLVRLELAQLGQQIRADFTSEDDKAAKEEEEQKEEESCYFQSASHLLLLQVSHPPTKAKLLPLS